MLFHLVALSVLLQAGQAGPALPQAKEGDFVVKNFTFNSGQTLPELRIHYRTLGTPKKDAQGIVRNAVLVMHGTGGTARSSSDARSLASCFCPDSRSTSRNTSS